MGQFSIDVFRHVAETQNPQVPMPPAYLTPYMLHKGLQSHLRTQETSAQDSVWWMAWVGAGTTIRATLNEPNPTPPYHTHPHQLYGTHHGFQDHLDGPWPPTFWQSEQPSL